MSRCCCWSYYLISKWTTLWLPEKGICSGDPTHWAKNRFFSWSLLVQLVAMATCDWIVFKSSSSCTILNFHHERSYERLLWHCITAPHLWCSVPHVPRADTPSLRLWILSRVWTRYRHWQRYSRLLWSYLTLIRIKSATRRVGLRVVSPARYWKPRRAI